MQWAEYPLLSPKTPAMQPPQPPNPPPEPGLPHSLTPLQPWLKGEQPYSQEYAQTTARWRALATHAEGQVPEADLQRRRPGEDETVQAYRRQIYQPVTQAAFGRVLSTLQGMRRAPQWGLHWPPDRAGLPEAEAPEPYLTQHYPWHGHVLNWLTELGLRQMLVDANAVVAVLPLDWCTGAEAEPPLPTEPADDLHRPYAFLFESQRVLAYHEGRHAVLRDTRRSWVTVAGQPRRTGEVLWYVTPQGFTLAEQTGEARERQFRLRTWQNPAGHWPCFRMGGRPVHYGAEGVVYESFLAPALPYWQEASRLYSDLQAVLVLHAYPEKIVYQNEACGTCSGTGQVSTPEGRKPCPDCRGTGFQRPGPYGTTIVRPPVNGESPGPWPSTVYVEKDTAIIRLLKDEVEDNLRKAYAALGLDFLAHTPLNESGRSKELDRQEIHRFIHQVAQHALERVVMQVIEATLHWRYPLLEPAVRRSLLPQPQVPATYDVLTEDHLAQELAQARSAGVAETCLHALQVEFARRKLGPHHPAWQELELVRRLDPFPGLSAAERMQLVDRQLATAAEVRQSLLLPRHVSDLLRTQPDAYRWTDNRLRQWLAAQPA